MSQYTAAQPDARTARSYWTMGRGDTDRAFREARRHSRRVRFARIALPVSVVLLLSIFGLWTWFNPMRLLLRIPDIGGDLVISGTKITMEAPRLTGYTRDNRWYELTAGAAAQDITKPNVVELHEVRAKVQAEDKSTMFLSARDGTFDRKANVLTLNTDITLKSTTG